MFKEALPIGNNPAVQGVVTARSNDAVFAEACAKHRDFVCMLASSEDQMECRSCVLYKSSFNEDTSAWTPVTWEAAVSNAP